MKFRCLIIVFIVSYQTGVSHNIELFRKLLILSKDNAEYARAFKLKTDNVTILENATSVGYKAMANFMMCKHVSNPFQKLNYFNSGKKYLEIAIRSDTNNIELLFLRYCVQKNVPKILSYSSDMITDKKKIMFYLNENTNKQSIPLEFINHIKKALN